MERITQRRARGFQRKGNKEYVQRSGNVEGHVTNL